MTTYLIKNQFSPLLFLVREATPSRAFSELATRNNDPLEDFIVDNNDLLEKGFKTMTDTHIDGVWELQK